MNQPYLTVDEVAEALNLPKRTVWRLIRDKELPANRFGKEYRVTRSDLDEYVRRTRTVGTEHENNHTTDEAA